MVIHVNSYILHLTIILYYIKIILQFCKWQRIWTNKFKEINLNCVWISVSASRSQSWAFQTPPTLPCDQDLQACWAEGKLHTYPPKVKRTVAMLLVMPYNLSSVSSISLCRTRAFSKSRKKPSTSLSFLKAFKTSFIKLWEAVSVESLAHRLAFFECIDEELYNYNSLSPPQYLTHVQHLISRWSVTSN